MAINTYICITFSNVCCRESDFYCFFNISNDFNKRIAGIVCLFVSEYWGNVVHELNFTSFSDNKVYFSFLTDDIS